MQTDMYQEAIANAKVLRERACKVAEQRVLETVRPKIDKYLTQVMLEGSDEGQDDNLLLGGDIDVTAGDEAGSHGADGQAIARDVAKSMSTDDEPAGVTVNSDGTYTLDMSALVVPADDSGGGIDADAGAAEKAKPAKSDDLVLTGEAASAFEKLNALREIASAITDKRAGYDRLVTAYESLSKLHVESATITADKESVVVLTNLAEHVRGTYKTLVESPDANIHSPTVRRLERIYGEIDGALVEAICTRVASKIDVMSSRVVNLAESASHAECSHSARIFYSEIDDLCNIIEAVAGRIDPTESTRMTARLAGLVEEIRHVTRRLNEDEVVLKLNLPDGMGDEVRGILGGEDASDDADEDEDIELVDDEGEEDEPVAESRRRLVREADDDDGDDVDEDDDIELVDDEGEEDDGSSSGVASQLSQLADIVSDAEGVELELVDDGDADDMGGMDDMELDLDLDSESDEGEGDDEVFEIDMHELASAVGRMRSRARPATRLAEGARNPTRTQGSTREVLQLKKVVAELKRKQGDSNLLSAKLLYTNRLLQRPDMTAGQRARMTSAMDQARNLGEVRLLYKNLTRELDKRQPQQLGEGRRTPMGSAARSTVTSGMGRGGLVAASKLSDGGLMSEAIDINMWKRHAGLEDE